MATRQYIGARYVPIFDGDWDNSKAYDPLVIVSYQGNSYTSRTFIPAGIDINNTMYWALTGNYNAQVEAYRQEVADLANTVDGLDDTVDGLVTGVEALENDTVKMSMPPAKSRYLKFELLHESPFTGIQGGTYVNGKFYMASVVSNVIYLNIYDPENSANNRTINLGVTGHASSITHYDGKLWIAGGIVGTSADNKNIYVFDLTTEEVSTITTDRTFSCAFFGNGCIGLLGEDNAIYIYRINTDNNKAYHLVNLNKVFVSSSYQGGYADNNFIYEIRSYSRNSQESQVGYDLILYTWCGDVALICKLLGMDGKEPEWFFRNGNTLYVGTVDGNIYFYTLDGEFYYDALATAYAAKNGHLMNVVPLRHKYDSHASYSNVQTNVYGVRSFVTSEQIIGSMNILGLHVPIGGTDDYTINAVCTIARSGVSLLVEVKYHYNSTGTYFDLSGLKVTDLINNQFYDGVDTALTYLASLGSAISMKIYIESLQQISMPTYQPIDLSSVLS